MYIYIYIYNKSKLAKDFHKATYFVSKTILPFIYCVTQGQLGTSVSVMVCSIFRIVI